MTSLRAPEPSGCPGGESLPGTARVSWHDPGIESTYVNAFTISAARDEVVVLLGLKQGRTSATDELTIRASDRVVLAPAVARQLLEQLADCIRAYERTYGPLDATAVPRTSASRRPPLGPRPRAEAGRASQQAAALFALVKSLNVGAGYERSVKLSERSLLGNRFLLGLSKRTLGQEAEERILDICARLRMPRDYLDALGERFADSNYVHFGFEESESACLYKVYLEFWQRIEENLRGNPDSLGPFLLHLGFKWDASENQRRTITRYTWHPWFTAEEMLSRVSRLLDAPQHGHTFDIVKGLVDVASERIPHQDILYLEVSEDGNPRRSFDINIYRANLRLAEMYPLWVEIGRQYSVPFQQMQAFYEGISQKTIGHVSGGTDREGKDFLTVYYGAEGLNGSGHPSGFSVGGSPPVARSRLITPPAGALAEGVERVDEKASRLYARVQSLNVQVAFERSFKFVENSVLADRFLMGIKRREGRQGLDDEILDTCRQIDMPVHFLEAFGAQLPEATIVLFGFERNEKSRVCKAYLEFGDRLGTTTKKRADTPEPVHIHQGFKWDATDNTRSRMTRYVCFPGLSIDDMLRRVWGAFYQRKGRRLIMLVESILNLAATRVGPRAFLYIEATEEGNPQASFDINIYRANLRLEELYPFLLQAGRYYSIPSERFHKLYEPVKTQVFGHVRGGNDKDGRDFLTIYFAEKRSSR